MRNVKCDHVVGKTVTYTKQFHGCLVGTEHRWSKMVRIMNIAQ